MEDEKIYHGNLCINTKDKSFELAVDGHIMSDNIGHFVLDSFNQTEYRPDLGNLQVEYLYSFVFRGLNTIHQLRHPGCEGVTHITGECKRILTRPVPREGEVIELDNEYTCSRELMKNLIGIPLYVYGHLYHGAARKVVEDWKAGRADTGMYAVVSKHLQGIWVPDEEKNKYTLCQYELLDDSHKPSHKFPMTKIEVVHDIVLGQ